MHHETAYHRACKVEEEAMPYFEAWLKEASYQGRFNLYYGKTSNNIQFQKQFGDASMQGRDGRTSYAVDMKAELHDSPNLFVEVWSNRSRQTLGWFETSNADYIAYIFLRRRVSGLLWPQLYFFRLQELRGGFGYRLNRYPLVEQVKYDQPNDTWGRLIPISHVKATVIGFQSWMFTEDHWMKAVEVEDTEESD